MPTKSELSRLTVNVVEGLENLKNGLRAMVSDSLKDGQRVQQSGNLQWNIVFEDGETQILVAHAIDDSTEYMEQHIHKDSFESFIVLNGLFEVNHQILSKGETTTIRPGETHRARALSKDLLLIVVCYPPESVYSNIVNQISSCLCSSASHSCSGDTNS